MTQYSRTDRLGGLSKVYSYFGGSNYSDAPICFGECATGKFYLDLPDEAPFYRQSDDSWSQDNYNNPAAKKFPSFLSLLNEFSIELFLESGEEVNDAIQTRTPLSQSMLNKFSVNSTQFQSFEDFNVVRHGAE
jgi:hypothetical protein